MKKLIVGCLMMISTSAANAFTSVDYLSLIIQGIRFSATEAIPEQITVNAIGVGETQPIAVQNALNLAVQKAIGVLIVTDQTVNNDKVIRNLVAQYSSGVVNSYEVKKCDGKPVSCEIVAKVSPWKFMRKLEGDSQTIKVNGNDLLAKHETAKIALIQRHKMAHYYMSQIRQSGLEVVVNSVSVLPNTSNKVSLAIEYEVKWNKEFKKDIIRFLEKLEKDTENENANLQVYIQWGPTGLFENRVRINTHSQNFQRMMIYHIYQPVHVRINELNICHDIQHEDVFTIGWHKVKRTVELTVEPIQLKNINTLTMGVSC